MADVEDGGVKSLVRRLASPPRGAGPSGRVRYAAVVFGASMAVILAVSLLAVVAPAPWAAYLALFLWGFAILVPAALLGRLEVPAALWLLTMLIMAALAWLAPGVLHSQALQLWGRSTTAVIAEHDTQRGSAPFSQGGRRGGGVATWSVQRYTLHAPGGTPIRPELVRGDALRARFCPSFQGDPPLRRPGEAFPTCGDRDLESGDTVAVVFDPLGVFPPMTEQDLGAPGGLLGGWLLGVGGAAGVILWAGWRAAPPDAGDRRSQADPDTGWRQARVRRRRRRTAERSRRRNRR